MLKNLLQKIFSFGQQKEKSTASETSFKKEPSLVSQKKHDTLSECCSLLRIALNQRKEKLGSEALKTLEKVIEIMEREGL